MASRQLDEERIFNIARKLNETEAQRDYLDQICAGDLALRDRVGALLEAAREDQAFLASAEGQVQETIDLGVSLEKPGTTIGRYKLMELIGEGGMGLVFAAQQDRPIRRKVALKVIKPGMDSKSVVARFEAERNALALMNHPNIAKVLDAGATDHGHPYFVMELIQGDPITDYCDQRKFSIRQRLDLFIQICNAVQHAHQKGVIHRDLKPTNILVTEIDGKPVPKVIDFGVAKALGANLTERTVYTSFQSLVGTTLYMSPEQTRLSGVDVDTGSDVYSLGILLYELLTGTTPLNPEELKQTAQDEVLRRIRETEPPRPSNRVSSLGDTTTRISDCRATRPEQLGQLLRGDLDWIVMKALEKDRNRRYKTADAFAVDIARHLDNDPVEARPPSTAYQVSRFYRRNRALVSVVMVIFSVTFLAAIATSVAWREANAKQVEAVEAQDRAEAKSAELQDSLQKRQELLHQLELALKSKAIEHAMNLDGDGMRRAIDEARLAGASEGWAKLVEAIAALFSGNAVEAHELLREAREKGENSISVDAFESWVNASIGDIDGWLKKADSLKRAMPKDAQDKLFLALALGPLEDLRSVTWASESFDETKSPVALLVLSQARAYQAGSSGNIEEAKKSQSEAEAALLYLADSPYALNANLLCNHLLWNLSQEVKDDAATVRYAEKAQQFVWELDRWADFSLGNFHAALFLEDVGDTSGARVRYQRLLRVNQNFDKYNNALFLYRQGNVSQALELANDLPTDSILSVAKAQILADIPERRAEAGKLILSGEFADRAGNFPGTVLGLLYAIGFPEDAMVQAKKILESELADSDDAFKKGKFLLLAGEINPGDFLATAGDDRLKQCEAHCLIAEWALGNGKRGLAKDHLLQCVGPPWFSEYRSAQTWLKKLEDPNWPHWIKVTVE